MATGPDDYPIDERVICASSGQVCVSKVSLLRQFPAEGVENQGIGGDGDTVGPFREDGGLDYDGPSDPYSGDEYKVGTMFKSGDWLLRTRLVEYDLTAKRIDCGGPLNGDCPARIVMTESKPRTRILQGLRKLGILSAR